ncbi:MAG: prepilin peptidase, partial [Bryobacterales bacterium]|nr:prepilin peptidase [Bryobacterales bacterium]
LNVCIYRMPRDLSVVAPRSFCPECNHQIAWFDNIPLLSYALLGGRCRWCKHRISARYPIVELLMGVLFFCAFWFLGATLAAVKFCVFGAIMIALVFSDLEERILPDEFTLGGTAVGAVFAAFVPLSGGILVVIFFSAKDRWLVSVCDSLLAAAICSGALWAVRTLYQKVRHREGLGLGDVKMGAMIGAFLGVQGALLTLLVGSLLGAIIGLCYTWFAGKDASTYELPFGSFLGTAALGVGFFGEVIFKWYDRLGA